jgi:hypothetical protein
LLCTSGILGWTSMDSELLVRLSALTKGKLLERRKEISKALVKAGLSNMQLGDKFTPRDLSIKIHAISNVKLADEAIISILEDLQTNGYTAHVSDLDYKILKKIEIIGFQDLTYSTYIEFKDFLEKNYKDYDPYIDKAVMDILNSILLKISIQFINSQETKIESLPIENFKSFLEEQVEGHGIKWKDRFVELFCEYFNSKPPKLLEFIFNVYSVSINMRLISKEQEMPELLLVDEVGFLLIDTSFLVALMGKTDPTHALASALTMQCKKRQVPLYYLDITKDEMNRLIYGSKLEMKGLIVDGNPSVIRSQFVRDFHELLKIEYIRWPDYYAELSNWENLLKLYWNISIFPGEYKIDQDTVDIVEHWLPILDQDRQDKRISVNPYYNKPPRDLPQIHHDAVCLGAIAASRKNQDEMRSIGPWFLTFDNLVFRLGEFQTQIDKQKLNLAIQPRTWLNYLLIFSKLDFEKEDQDEIAEALLIFTTHEHETRITLEDYAKLIAEKFNLNREEAQLIKEIFLKTPLNAELTRALEAGRGGDADRVTQNIIDNKEFIDSVLDKRRTKEDLQRVASTLRETVIQLREEKAAREALERISGYNILIKTDIRTTVEVNIETQINGLVSLLKAQLPEGFERYNLPEPPKGETRLTKIKGWLTDLKDTIDKSKDIAEGVKSLLPYIILLIGQLSQYAQH